MGKRIYVICQVFYPDTTSTSQLFTELFAVLSERADAEITVLCSHPSGKLGKERSWPSKEVHRGVHIRRLGFKLDHKAGLISRALVYAGYLLGVFFKLMTVPRRDAVFMGVTNPPFVAWVLWFASLLRGIKYDYMIQDAYPEGLIALGMKRSSPIAKLWYFLNRLAYRRAERMIVLGRDMAEVIETNYGIPSGEVVYLPHWSAVEYDEPLPAEGRPLLAELDLADRFVVQYSGNMGIWHDIELFVRAAERLKDEDRVRLMLVGDGVRRAGAEALDRERNPGNIIWRDFVPLDEVRESLASCHAALICLRDGFFGIAVPCKVYGILASGRAIIAQVPAGTEIALTVEESECGVVVEPGDDEALARVIAELAGDPERVARYGANAFRAYREKYRQAQAVVAFSELWGLSERRSGGGLAGDAGSGSGSGSDSGSGSAVASDGLAAGRA
ncbi:MAG: glycosyltransferase family 4 protein [Planctomycetota bacterium]